MKGNAIVGIIIVIFRLLLHPGRKKIQPKEGNQTHRKEVINSLQIQAKYLRMLLLSSWFAPSVLEWLTGMFELRSWYSISTYNNPHTYFAYVDDYDYRATEGEKEQEKEGETSNLGRLSYVTVQTTVIVKICEILTEGSLFTRNYKTDSFMCETNKLSLWI